MPSIVIGKCYYHKEHFTATVRKVIKIEDGLCHYQILHGPQLKRTVMGQCKLHNFKRWAHGDIREQDDYTHLDGCIKWPTVVVQNTQGEPIFRCNQKRKEFYLRKGYATEVGEGLIRLNDTTTEDRLKLLYGPELHEFFMQVKNDRCVVCGCENVLSRHHVIPRRHIKKLCLKYRSCLSNILFVCRECHNRYESHTEPEVTIDPNVSVEAFYEFCHAWRDHFFETMEPKHLPVGWTIITVRNLDAVEVA